MATAKTEELGSLDFRLVDPDCNEAVLTAGQPGTLILTITNNTGRSIAIRRSAPTLDLDSATEFGLVLTLDELFTDASAAKGITVAAGKPQAGLTAHPADPTPDSDGGVNGWVCSWLSDEYGSGWALAAAGAIDWDDGEILTFTLSGVTATAEPRGYNVTVTHNEDRYAADATLPVQVRGAGAPAKRLGQAVAFSITNPDFPDHQPPWVLITKDASDDIDNTLMLTLTLKDATAPLVTAAAGDRRPTLSVTAAWSSTAPGRRALAMPDRARSVAASVAPGDAWSFRDMRPGPIWDFTPTTEEVLGPKAGASVTITLAGLVTPFASGPTTVTLSWTDIPGYADGSHSFVVEKRYPNLSLASFTGTAGGKTGTILSLPGGYAPTPGTVALEWDVRYATNVVLSGYGPVPPGTGGVPLVLPVSRGTTFVLTAYDTVLGDIQTATVTVTMERSTAAGCLPYGAILLWKGGSDALPPGFVLCDGTRGTPDLRDRFVIGAGALQQPGDRGDGNHTHRLNAQPVPSATTVSTDGGHDHGLPTNWFIRGLSCGKWCSIDAGGWDNSRIGRLQGVEGHAHTVKVTLPVLATDGVTGGTRPPWFALCYIMRVPGPTTPVRTGAGAGP